MTFSKPNFLERYDAALPKEYVYLMTHLDEARPTTQLPVSLAPWYWRKVDVVKCIRPR